MTRSPSPISSHSDGERINSITHESYGFRPEPQHSYSLAYSATPLALNQDSGKLDSEDMGDDSRVIRLPTEDLEGSVEVETSINSVGNPENRRRAPTDTTRLLNRVVEMQETNTEIPKYTRIPPQKVKSRHYPEHVKSFADSKESYVQILIWCLQRRINMLNESPPTNLTTSLRFELIHALQMFQSRLLSGAIVPEWSSHGLLNLKPRMDNPENKRSEQIITDLEKLRRKHISQNRQSWHELKQSENMVATAKNIDHEYLQRSNQGNIQLTNINFEDSSYGDAVKRSVKERDEILGIFLRNIHRADALHVRGMLEVREALENSSWDCFHLQI